MAGSRPGGSYRWLHMGWKRSGWRSGRWCRVPYFRYTWTSPDWVGVMPPRRHHNFQIFQEVVDTLSSRQIMILGDFNAFSTDWGAQKTNTSGRLLQDIMVSARWCIANDPSCETIWSPNTNRVSSPHFPDLTLLSSDVRSHSRAWRVAEDIGSDHLPVLFECGRNFRHFSKVL
jgi:endonuclease/exonuclease/phosphatase family metal-dependent hydrolase